jgi:hypothetical protein
MVRAAGEYERAVQIGTQSQSYPRRMFRAGGAE